MLGLTSTQRHLIRHPSTCSVWCPTSIHASSLRTSLWDAPSPPHRSGMCLRSGAHPLVFFSLFFCSPLTIPFLLQVHRGSPLAHRCEGGRPPFFTMACPSAHKRVVRRCSRLVRFFFFPLSLLFRSLIFFTCSPLRHMSHPPSSRIVPLSHVAAAFSPSPDMQHDVIGSPDRAHPFAHHPGVWGTTRHRPPHRVLPWEAGTHHWFGNPQPTLGGRGRAGVANDSGVVLHFY
jgi:hypothetical protein